MNQQHIKSNDLGGSEHRSGVSGAKDNNNNNRRSSVQATASTKPKSSTDLNSDTSRSGFLASKGDTKRPLNAVMSEDYLTSASSAFPSPSSSVQPISSAQKQSFLAKFARSEVKSSKSIDKSSQQDNKTATNETRLTSQTNNENSQPLGESNTTSNSNKSNINTSGRSMTETESDNKQGQVETSKSLRQARIETNNPQTTRASKSFCESDVSEQQQQQPTPPPLGLQRKSDIRNEGNNEQKAAATAVNDEDDNQVLPAWPSKIEAATALEPSFIQHQVYSLKDYSQVSGPSETNTTTTAAAASSKLQKSMSQDRKVGTRANRMSECIISSGASIDNAKTTSRQQRLPSMIGKISSGSNLGSIGPASSVNSLLLPAGKNPTLIAESRIDRMRKLFVSPLSLRGSTTNSVGTTAAATSSGSGKPSAQPYQASTHSRLSLQAGANMLNKPHHLMHMYRARVAVGAHHSRRSPMRQSKQGNIKGFRVYGCPLSMANTMYPITCFGRPDIYKQQAVPYILARLCNYIEENSSQLTHEGIFRVSGNARLMEKLKTLFDHLGDAPLESESVDVATSASMLKMYLRELPDPLIPTRMNYYFFTLAKKYQSLLFKSTGINGLRLSDNMTSTTSTVLNETTSSVSDSQSTLDRHRLAFMRDLTKLIRKLPIENYNLLKYLACFLHRISLKQQSNKMSAEALGIVFGPNVFRIRSESYKGLKEQELSNQIMASIISNYKQIFDCELTDPLGNLIKGSDEFLHLSHEHQSVTSERPGQSSDFDAPSTREPISSRASKSEHSAVPPAIIPATSTATYESVLHHQARCPKHGHPSYGYNDDRNKSDNEDENADDDDDDEEDECDDESYSQTSGSGSYCSSLASDTVESTYEGDIEGEHFDDDDDELAREEGTTGTSSDCGSETSYTPSSSHSDSDDEDVGAELSSSNFSSNFSLNGANEGDNEANAAAHRPCHVCRRRESTAQLEASKLREQLQAAAATATSGPPISKNEEKLLAASTGDYATGDNDEPSGQSDGRQNQLTSSGGGGTKNHSRVSTRRRLECADDAAKKAASSPASDPNGNIVKPEMTSSELVLNADDDGASDQAKPGQSERLSRYAASSHHHGKQQNHKHNLLRRRSSSASSLVRLANRHDHLAQKRTGAKEEHHRHHRRARVNSERHRASEPRAFNRKSRYRSHQAKRGDGHAAHHDQQVIDENKPSSSKGCRQEWNKGDFYVPELIAMKLSPQNRRDLVWNYVSSALLDLPESERFFQLRSYNSDETLLKSQECPTDTNSVNTNLMARRRFSGQDHLQSNHQSLLENACTEFNQIFETYEGDGESLAGVEPDNFANELLQPRSLGESAAAVVDSSVISLLGDQMFSFKHSNLSLNEQQSTDPIVAQLKVTRDLVKALQRLSKHGTANGFNQDVSAYLLELSQDLDGADGDPDKISTSYIDHFTSKDIVDSLDSLKRDYDDLPKVDLALQKRLIEILGLRIAELKKRYNNLKYIREHYHRHHAKLKQTSGMLDNSASSKPAESPSTGDHDRKSVRSELDALSIDSTLSAQAIAEVAKDVKQSGADIDSRQAGSCKFGPLCPVEFVFNIEKQLASRRQSGSRQVRLHDMTLAQLQSEKLELQKNLLRYEHWFGRPSTRAEFNLVGHLYERYRAVKIIKQRKQASD